VNVDLEASRAQVLAARYRDDLLAGLSGTVFGDAGYRFRYPRTGHKVCLADIGR
jgi:hypothetical protein